MRHYTSSATSTPSARATLFADFSDTRRPLKHRHTVNADNRLRLMISGRVSIALRRAASTAETLNVTLSVRAIRSNLTNETNLFIHANGDSCSCQAPT
jgi:hypothetical protein